MLDRRPLGAEAAAKALWLRKRLNVSVEDSISSIDSAESLGLEVRTVDLPSMEGMYIAGENPRILISSLRPQGRRNFTCAHELGHHIFGHGQQFDEMKKDRSPRRIVDPKEFLADCFASYLLMPKSAIEHRLAQLGLDYGRLTPADVYAIASWLGVGYTTLINHLEYGLGKLSHAGADGLRRQKLPAIRMSITGCDISSQLHVVDRNWRGRPIDCEVGDYLYFDRTARVEGRPLGAPQLVRNGILVLAERTGIARVSAEGPEWASFIRVTKERYVGRSCYRFDEEMDE